MPPCVWSHQQAIATRPPGASTRRISPTAAARSGKNCRPCWHVTASKESSGKGSASALPAMKAMPSDSSRATTSIGGARSIPVTDAPACASRRLSAPVPHATSSTRDPDPVPDASTTTSASAENIAGTRYSW